MISIKINDINNFMQNLLVKNTFDSFLISETEINTSVQFNINGRINNAFYDNDELKSMYEDFITWEHIKHICFDIIRGKKVPTEMKIVFAFPKSKYNQILKECNMNITAENIGGLYLHVHYINNQISIITGSSLNIFTLDKTLDKYWDNLMKNFLGKYFEIEEI